MDWIKEIDYKKYLTGDLKALEEVVGIDVLLKIIKAFAKTTIYISEKPLMEMKQEYIRKKFGEIPDKELARKLGVSERLVYKIASQKIYSNNQVGLFDDK